MNITGILLTIVGMLLFPPYLMILSICIHLGKFAAIQILMAPKGHDKNTSTMH